MDLHERFWSKVDKAGPVVHPELGPCWVWTASVMPGKWAYGMFGVGDKPRRAHRVSWEMAHGQIPVGMFVCHRCDNPRCVRPDHLFLGTASQNTADCIAKGRFTSGPEHAERMRRRDYKPKPRFGKDNAASKLCRDAVVTIRALHAMGRRQVDIARFFGVSQVAISNVVRKATWRDV